MSEEWAELQEGAARLLYPAAHTDAGKRAGAGTSVFYNPAMATNRDLSLAVAQVHLEELEAASPARFRAAEGARVGMRVLEALSASGLRSVRYARELEGLRGGLVHSVVANDLLPRAVDAIRRNVLHNGLAASLDDAPAGAAQAASPAPPVLPHLADANECMRAAGQLRQEERYDVVDVDPYGAPSPFLDAAVQAVRDGGVLGVTATDMPVLCGNYPETCWAKYGCISVKGPSCHEQALRVLLGTIEGHAVRHKRYIEPLLSFSVDHYVRVFVRVRTSAAKVKGSASRMGYVHQCIGCGSHVVQPMMTEERQATKKGGATRLKQRVGRCTAPLQCEHCGWRHQTAGPMWIAPTSQADVVSRVLDVVARKKDTLSTHERLSGRLRVLRDELHDVPMLWDIPHLATVLRLQTPPKRKLEAALTALGHRFSESHTSSSAFKTDAPAEVVWDLMRRWAVEHPPKPRANQERTAGHAILQKEPTVQAKWDAPLPKKGPREARFFPNPTANWGPKARPVSTEKAAEKAAKRAAKKRSGSEAEGQEPPHKRKKEGDDADDAAVEAGTQAQEP